ncbi:MAG: MotA/TolQ/ExbB proton channel family protein [Boseongicola sp.]
MDVSADITLLERGGVVIWIIGALSVVAATIIIWKTLRLISLGAWGGAAAERAVAAFEENGAIPTSSGGGIRLVVVRAAIRVISDLSTSESAVREEAERVARKTLAEARRGLRALDVIATISPLLGLLGTVLGMIAAFQALQSTGARADPAVLAGGIWEALLTTAAGMAVAIPVALALAWFESVIERVSEDLEDLLTRLFLARPKILRPAAE